MEHFVNKLFPRAKVSDEASARFEIPLDEGKGEGIAGLFRTLEERETERREVGVVGYQISPVSLESLFLHIVRKAQSAAGRDEIGAHHDHHDTHQLEQQKEEA